MLLLNYSLNSFLLSFSNTLACFSFLAISFNDKNILNAFLKKHDPFESIQTSIEQKILEEKFCVLDGYPLNLVLDKNGNVIDAWYEENPDSTKQDAFYNKVKRLIDKNL